MVLRKRLDYVDDLQLFRSLELHTQSMHSALRLTIQMIIKRNKIKIRNKKIQDYKN